MSLRGWLRQVRWAARCACKAFRDEVRPARPTGRIAGGTFTLSTGRGRSDPLPYDADARAVDGAVLQALERHDAHRERQAGLREDWLRFLRDDAGLETVEWAILAAGIIFLATILVVAVIGLWSKVQERILGGKLDWDPGPGYSGDDK